MNENDLREECDCPKNHASPSPPEMVAQTYFESAKNHFSAEHYDEALQDLERANALVKGRKRECLFWLAKLWEKLAGLSPKDRSGCSKAVPGRKTSEGAVSAVQGKDRRQCLEQAHKYLDEGAVVRVERLVTPVEQRPEECPPDPANQDRDREAEDRAIFFFHAGRIFLELGELDRARERLKSAIETLEYTGVVRWENGERKPHKLREGILREFDTEFRAVVRLAEAYCMRGQAAEREKDWRNAKQDYDRAIEVLRNEGDATDAEFYLAILYEYDRVEPNLTRADRLSKALDSINEFIKRKSPCGSATEMPPCDVLRKTYLARGRIHMAMENPFAAAGDFRKVADCFENYTTRHGVDSDWCALGMEAYFRLGEAHWKLAQKCQEEGKGRNLRDARQALERVLNLVAECKTCCSQMAFQAHDLLARCLEFALRNNLWSREPDTDDMSLRQLVNEHFEEAKRQGQRLAEDLYRQALACSSDPVDDLAPRSKRPRGDGRLELLNKAILLNPKHYEALYCRGLLHAERPGQLKEAIRDFKAIIAEKPDHWQARLRLAQAFADQGDNMEAIRLYERLLRDRQGASRVEQAVIHEACSRAYSNSGDHQRAADHIKKAKLLRQPKRNQ